MEGFAANVLIAFWLGILTSVSPCPLATNIAALSFVGKKISHPKAVLFSGVVYTAGRTVTYLGLGALLVTSLLSAPAVSHALQKYMNMFLGPLLIIVGMVLLELISVTTRGRGVSDSLRARIEHGGPLGVFLLGGLFALSFCPVSGALFFGSLLPMAIRTESAVVLPVSYGIATGLPVLLFAFLVAFGARKVSEAYNRVVSFEKWARKGTGIIFVLVGVYLTLVHVFRVSFL